MDMDNYFLESIRIHLHPKLVDLNEIIQNRITTLITMALKCFHTGPNDACMVSSKSPGGGEYSHYGLTGGQVRVKGGRR